jgi:transcriptional regulator with XRE-family HTH domain
MPESTPVKRAARHMHPMDIHVGLLIRQRRRLLDMSQHSLGAAVGLSFQMIQRYEDGSNSVPASCLFEFARVLDVPPSFIFEGPRRRALYTRENMELIRAYFAIHDPMVRESIAETIRAISTAPLSHRRGA